MKHTKGQVVQPVIGGSGLTAKFWIVRALAAVLILASLVLTVSVVLAVAVNVIPLVPVQLFAEMGIGIEEGMTFANFEVKEAIVLLMIWGFPSLFITIILAIVQYKLIQIVFRKVIRWSRVFVGRNS